MKITYNPRIRSPPAGTSRGSHFIDIPIQDATADDGEAYKEHARAVRPGPAPKKFTVMPSDRGGRLDVPSRKTTQTGAEWMAEFESDQDTILLDAVHRPRKHRQATHAQGPLDINPKV